MIKIFKNGIELDVVKETLTINRDNKFLDNEFKIQANNFPFLIIENENTRNILGSRLPTSTLRDTFHTVSVLTPEGFFEGELQILSYLKNYRKCNLRFYSPIYNLRDKKIAEFLPERISTVPGIIQPTYNYEETRTSLISKNFVDSWKSFGANILPKGFPETLFNLPNYNYPNKFGDDLNEDDDWFYFKGSINGTYYENGKRHMRVNSYSTFAGETVYDNNIVTSPQVYLLAPIKLAVESVGYKVKGNFYTNEFIKRVLFYSEKNNLCEIKLNSLVMDIPYVSGGWQIFGGGISIKQILFQVPVGKRYKVEIQLKNTSTILVRAQVNVIGVGGNVEVQLFENPPINEIQTYSAEFVPPYTGTSTANVVISFIKQSWITDVETLQFNYIRISEIANKTGYLSHPIINLQRYVPDWSFIDYINELKKLFNLKITPNDHDKTISFDFFNDKFIQKSGVKIDPVYIDDFETHEFDSLLLKYDNEEDDNVFVTKNSVIVGKNKPLEHTKEVPSKFKFMPVTASGLTLTKEIEDKGGVGLIIYNHSNLTTSSPVASYQGYNLTLENIYDKNYQLSFKNYLSSGIFPTTAFLSTKQIKDTAIEDFVYIDNKRYYVNTMSFKETPNGQYETKFELLLMMY